MPDPARPRRRRPVTSLEDAAGWIRSANSSESLVGLIRRARRALPGDPDFGDPLSVTGEGGPRAAARVADRLMADRAASREVSLGALQVWQAINERLAGREISEEVTLAFGDLVGFSTWTLQAGDEAALAMLRRVAQVGETPVLEAGGRIVKRMGDGIMTVHREPLSAVQSMLEAHERISELEADGYNARVRIGIHTGRPQRLGDVWFGVDVNITTRVMEQAPRGGVVVSGATLDKIDPDDLADLGVRVKRVGRHVFGSKPAGVPTDLAMYRLDIREKRDDRNAPGLQRDPGDGLADDA